MDPLYKRAVINKCTQVVSELHGKVGTITKRAILMDGKVFGWITPMY